MNKWKNYYPRPLLKRDSFFSLDGTWMLNGKEIEVPFPRESELSLYEGSLEEDVLTYEKEFALPAHFKKASDRVMLHLGAVDQTAEIYLNDVLITRHEGGYLPIKADVTDALKMRNRLKIIATDKLDHFYPYGKQTENPEGMWYTKVSGIWQSVWMEAVPRNGIRNLQIKADREKLVLDVDSDCINFFVSFPMEEGKKKKIKYFRQLYEEKHVEIKFSDIGLNPHLWDLEDPYLYPLTISNESDEIESYFAVRDFKVINGKTCLNGKPLLLSGVLDQGYFHDGIYLPEDPQEYFNDVLRMKELGFSILRKHIKVEPEVFYYACDRLGMLVMQDMVNSGDFSFVRHALLPTLGLKYRNDRLFTDGKRYDFFIEHSKGIINHLKSHPCIIAWTIYNEGWGQQKSDEAYKILKTLDEDRLFDSTSGWFAGKLSDFDSHHIYFRNKILKQKKKNKLLFLSECGGFKRPIEGHLYLKKEEYGYGKTLNSEEDISDKYEEMYEKMIYPSIENGMCGYIITQLSDVEGEINGFYTYDRQVCKVNKKTLYRLNNKAKEMYQK